MPVYRGPDGKIIEEKTVKSDPPTIQETRAAPPPPPPPGQLGEGSRFDAPTRKSTDFEAGRGRDDPKTRLVGARRRREDDERLRAAADRQDAMDDPVVGWLVVVSGPGKGRALKLGYGANSIGRGETDRVKLAFGDDQVSRSAHAVVTYDPRGRKFYVQHGGGTNLTYLGDAPVLAPMELPALASISIGNTVLRFVPFCGSDFDWQDSEDAPHA